MFQGATVVIIVFRFDSYLLNGNYFQPKATTE